MRVSRDPQTRSANRKAFIDTLNGRLAAANKIQKWMEEQDKRDAQLAEFVRELHGLGEPISSLQQLTGIPAKQINAMCRPEKNTTDSEDDHDQHHAEPSPA